MLIVLKSWRRCRTTPLTLQSLTRLMESALTGKRLASARTRSTTESITKQRDGINYPPPPIYFAELQRVSKNQIIWGANYFVPMLDKGTKGWIVWFKGQTGLTMSDCELAYSSFDCPTRLVTINRLNLQDKTPSTRPKSQNRFTGGCSTITQSRAIRFLTRTWGRGRYALQRMT